MDLSGKWSLYEVLAFDEAKGGLAWKKKEDFDPEDEENESYLKTFDSFYVFREDGKLLALVALPEGMTVEEIKAEGLEMYGEDVIIETKDWKIEDEKLFIDSGEYRELNGEVQSSWDEIKRDGDVLELEFTKLKKF